MKKSNLFFGPLFLLPLSIIVSFNPSIGFGSFVLILILTIISLYKGKISLDSIYVIYGCILFIGTFFPLFNSEGEIINSTIYFFIGISVLLISTPYLPLDYIDKNFGKILSFISISIVIIVTLNFILFKPIIVKYDWCYPSCSDDVQSSFKFSSDGTFTFSTIMFGGMSRWGEWEKIDDNTFRLTTTRISTNSSNDQLPNPQTVELISEKKLKVGGTTYVGED